MLTPKLGLVDQRNNGAHHDMDLQILLTSAHAIAPWWPRFVQIQTADPTAARHGILPDRGVYRATLPLDAARKFDVHRQQLHRAPNRPMSE